MVQASDTRTRKHLLDKMPLVPYADDGPATRSLIERIHNEMAAFGSEPSPDALDGMDKLRPRWTRELKEARYRDFVAAKANRVC